MVHSFVDFNLHMPANAMVAVAILALATTYIRYSTEAFWTASYWKYVACAAVVGLLFYLLPHALQTRNEQRFLTSARGMDFMSTNRITALKNAFAIEPKNSVTAYDLSEVLWRHSLGGYKGYDLLAKESVEWAQKSVALNRHEAQAHIGIGLGLDWLDQHEQAAPYYIEGLKHDPNGYSAVAYAGYHEVQAGNYARAKEYFLKSLELKPAYANKVAATYLDIVTKKMTEKAGQP
jgi:tetratricopeptide (TPR) repeat protein